MKRNTVYISEDESSLVAIGCSKYRKYNRKDLKDIVLALVSKNKKIQAINVDKAKSKKMFELLRKKEIEKREINIVLDHDLSGFWSTNCIVNKSGVVVKKLRDNYYHFLICSSTKCINVPRISSSDVAIIDTENIKISGQNYELCSASSE
jgi:hypothetical protein